MTLADVLTGEGYAYSSSSTRPDGRVNFHSYVHPSRPRESVEVWVGASRETWAHRTTQCGAGTGRRPAGGWSSGRLRRMVRALTD